MASGKTSSVVWWVFAFIFTLSIAYYQRVTGPTYPISGKKEFDGKHIEYKFLTSNESHIPARITISGDVEGITAVVKYRRFKADEHPKSIDFRLEDAKLVADIPPEPPAGKLEYNVSVSRGENRQTLNENPVVIRFKGAVPGYVLIPHVILMFGAMLFSTRTGIEALRRGPKLKQMAFITLILLAGGGMILGPVVQNFAFGAYWTGWPFGQDLTDNKTLVAFLAWMIAWLRIRKDESNRKWAIVAAVILLAVYLIPHSMFGSELDYTTGEINTGK
jgi:hypothetical protein